MGKNYDDLVKKLFSLKEKGEWNNTIIDWFLSKEKESMKTYPELKKLMQLSLKEGNTQAILDNLRIRIHDFYESISKQGNHDEDSSIYEKEILVEALEEAFLWG